MTDRVAIVRSLVGSEGQHSAFQCMHGRTQQRQPSGGWPSLGSTVSKLRGPTREGMPPFVGLSPKMITQTWAIVGEPGFLGRAYAAVKPNADGMGSMVLKDATLEHLGNRRRTVLLEDLRVRGLEKDVTVLVWGEFGRTPRINPNGGRDHWPQVGCAILAGGGMRTGQVIGSTNRYAEHAKDRPVHFQEVFATLYHNLGLNPRTHTVTDLSGRPQYLVDDPYVPLHELG